MSVSLGGKAVDLARLEAELRAAGFAVTHLVVSGDTLFMTEPDGSLIYDADGRAVDRLPHDADKVVAASAPPTPAAPPAVPVLKQAGATIAASAAFTAEQKAILGPLFQGLVDALLTGPPARASA